MKMINKPLGLYIHIPYCLKKCRYCDFLSVPSACGVPDSYVDQLVREIGDKAALFGSDAVVETVYFGGGTPSLLTLPQLERIMAHIRQCFRMDEQIELTIEVNPETLSQQKADGLRKAGFNRLSIGVQSLDDGLLQRLGRVHTAERARQAFESARRAGFRNLSLDLMMGLPGQSLKQWQDTLDEVISWDPEHLSCYSLIVEEGTPFYEDMEAGCLGLPEEVLEREMYHDTLTRLAEGGYEQYEISNFSKPGFESRHNLSYWIRTPYLGLGAGAASLIGEKRLRNESSLKRYTEMPVNRISSIEEELTEADQMNETMLLGLRLKSGVSRDRFVQQYHADPEQIYGDEIEGFVQDGLLVKDETSIRLTDRGLDLANQVFMAFV